MPLNKQQAVVPFAGGLVTNQNEFLLEPPNLLNLENGVFRKQGEISKRYGFSKLSKEVAGGGSISVGKKLSTFNDDLVLFTDTNLYSYSQAAEKWYDKGAFASIEVTKEPVSRSRFSQTVPTTSTIGGLILTAWEDSRGGVRYSILEEDTGSTVVPEVSLPLASYPVCSTIQNQYMVLLYIEAGTLKSLTFDAFTPESPVANPNITTVGATEALDAVPYDTFLLVGLNNVSNNTELRYLRYDDALGVVTTGSAVTLNSGSPYTSEAIALFTDIERKYVYAASYTGTNVRLQASFQDISAPASTNVDVGFIANVTNITGISRSIDNRLILMVELSNSSSQRYIIYKAELEYDGTTVSTVSGLTIFKRSVGLASHLFENSNTVYVTSAHESDLQPTYFLLEVTDGAPISAKILSSIAGGHTLKPLLPRYRTDSSGFLFTSLLEVTRLQAEEDGVTIRDNTGVVRTTLNFDTPPFQAQQIGQNLLIAGGFITAYDGTRVVEHNFHLYPESVSTSTNPTGGTFNPGTYRVAVTYEWTDAKGQIHRSAPSITKDQSIAGTQELTVTAPTLRLTAKENVKIVFYVSEADGLQLLYRAGTIDNSLITDTVTFTLDSDSGLNTQEILYTSQGIVESVAAPAATLIQTHQNRVFIAGLEDENALWYSRESVNNEGLSFSDFFRLRINPESGGNPDLSAITALGTLDDKLIIFKQNSIYALTGQGPTDTGTQNDFQQPERISSDVGCNAPSSIVTTSDGLLFNSPDGIKLLNRGLQIVDVGSPIEEESADKNITSAVLLAEQDEVRFTTQDAEAFIYNNQYNLWSKFTNYSAVSATKWKGSYLHLKEDGTVNREISGLYTDNGASIKLLLQTPWLAFGGLMGYKRIYQIMMLGKRLTNHAFRASLAYDYSELTRQVVFFNTTTGMEAENYSPSSSELVPSRYNTVATGNSVYQFRIKPTIQKCESIQLTISDIPLNNEKGAGFVLTGLNALLGVNTQRQLPVSDSQTVGD